MASWSSTAGFEAAVADRSRRVRPPRRVGSVVMATALGVAMVGSAIGAFAATSGAATPTVLRVGTYDGIKGQYTSIQSAVNAAKPGDIILIGPGDYHEDDDLAHPPTAAEASVGDMGGVLVTTPDLIIRGMNRSSVIIDGTKKGAPKACDSAAKYQQLGASAGDGKHYGRNGIVVWKSDNVSIENLTACNFLGGTGAAGNEIWWNGGASSGKIGEKGYWGSYLTATTTFFDNESTAAQYGIFSSNSAGPGEWDEVYANNFNDSGMYVGACQQLCDMTIDHAWMENNALGYSGTNSGGYFDIEHSQFDDNEDGFDTNTQIDGDPPAPQDGLCPNGGTSPITHTHSCWVFRNNYVHNNNNPSTPKAGSAAAGPTGTGMTVSGGTWDTIEHNTFEDNGAWGILFVPYPDEGTPVLGQKCANVGGVEFGAFGCVFDPKGDALLHNTFVNDGYFKNPSNSDYGEITLFDGQPQNCFVGNHAPNGSSPSDLETTQKVCGPISKTAIDSGPLLDQVLCDTGFGGCPKNAHYPKLGKVILHPVPKDLPSMPNPCQGVPDNPWCPEGGSTPTTTWAPSVVHAAGLGATDRSRRVRL